MPLTDIAVRQAKARDRAYKLSDEGGLCLLIQSSGAKYWLFRYLWAGLEKMLSVGVYPHTYSARLVLELRRPAGPGVQRALAKVNTEAVLKTSRGTSTAKSKST